MPLQNIRFSVAGRPWVADLTRAIDLSRTMRFTGSPACWFGASPPTAEPLRSGDFVGSVALGGPVNAAVLTLTPHGNGTHTEGIGHITRDAASVLGAALPALIPAAAISVENTRKSTLEAAFAGIEAGFHEAVLLRRTGESGGFDPEGVAYLRTSGVVHLLVAEASIDPESDGGRLSAHRAFWGVAEGASSGADPRTITELVEAAGVPDGCYLLDLQIPPLATDAVPSRPILYPVTRAD